MPGKLDDLKGQRFGLLTVLELVEVRYKQPYWRCRCDCGNETIVRAHKLREGRIVSCGCWRKLGGSTFTAMRRGSLPKAVRLVRARKAGLANAAKTRIVTDDIARAARDRFFAGETATALAREIGVAAETLHRAWRKLRLY